MGEICKNTLQLRLGDDFSPRNSGVRIAIPNLPPIIKPPIIESSISFKRQLVFNEETVTASFRELLPHLYRIPKGQEIKVTFETGGYGWVNLQKPAYVIHTETVDRNMYWIPIIPPVVKHPVYKSVWTFGFKDVVDPETRTRVRKFSPTRIIYNRKNRRKVERKDLKEFIDIWRDTFAKKIA